MNDVTQVPDDELETDGQDGEDEADLGDAEGTVKN